MDEKPGREKPRVTVNPKFCKSCGICAAFCPKTVFVQDKNGFPEVINEDKCIKCMLCVDRCPDFAIEISTYPLQTPES